MAGAPAMADNSTENSMIAIREQKWQWPVRYSRCFTYPSSYLSSTTVPPSLSLLKTSLFKPIWLSASESSTLSLHHPSADGSSSDSIVTVSLQDTVIEEHFVSKLHFTWPQVSCISGFPSRGSLVVFASYTDSANEKQKFALRFSTVSEAEDFINSLEDIFSNKIPKKLPAANIIPAMSSESGVVVPYRPEMTNTMTPTYASPVPNHSHTEEFQDSQAQERMADYESNGSSFPPGFTSLVSNCSAVKEEGNLAVALPSESKDFNLRAQIVKYMQDSSFLDIVNKVNEVITDLGEDFVL